MKKAKDKMKKYSVLTVLVVICLVLVGMIYSASQNKEDNQQVAEVVDDQNKVVVDEIEANSSESDISVEEMEEATDKEIVVEPVDIPSDDNQEEDGEVVVEVIEVDDNTGTEVSVIEVEEIEEPIAEEPDKPEQTPPDEIPETTDNLTNPDVVPEYDEEETTYVPDPEPEEPQDEVRGSNLVPDSENPFLQDDIPSNGEGGEIQGEDLYQDGVPAGEGDKF